MPASLLWRHRALFFNPRFGRLGVLDLPRYAFNLLVAPWLELAALATLVFAVPLGVLTIGQLLLVLVTIGLGSGILSVTALLLTGLPGTIPGRRHSAISCWPAHSSTSRPGQLC